MHNRPAGAPRPNARRNSACDRTRPGRAAEQRRIALRVGLQQDVPFGAEQRVDAARAEQMNAVQTETAGWGGRIFNPDRDDIDIKQHGQIGRDDLQQLLEAGGGRIASAALCVRPWFARLPRLAASRVRCSRVTRASSRRNRSIWKYWKSLTPPLPRTRGPGRAAGSTPRDGGRGNRDSGGDRRGHHDR